MSVPEIAYVMRQLRFELLAIFEWFWIHGQRL